MQPPEPRKPAEGPDFKLPDVPKLTFDTPKEIADKALPEALKNLPPPPTPSEPPLVNLTKPLNTAYHTASRRYLGISCKRWLLNSAAVGLLSSVCDLCTGSGDLVLPPLSIA